MHFELTEILIGWIINSTFNFQINVLNTQWGYWRKYLCYSWAFYEIKLIVNTIRKDSIVSQYLNLNSLGSWYVRSPANKNCIVSVRVNIFNLFNATNLHCVETKFTELELISLWCNPVQVRNMDPNFSSNVLSESLSWIYLVDVGTCKVSNLSICLPIEIKILLF